MKLPRLGRASAAVRRIEELALTLAEREEEPVAADPARPEAFRELALEGVTFVSGDADERHRFTLGPIDLSIHPGNLTFIIGGNGSGKTTLAKIPTGLYTPDEGALSQGQRKRLALLTAYLEDREVYVFDEWAADRDPAFKRIFFLKLLPELTKRGKAVVVITHDDRYFDVADRIIKLENGRIRFDGSVEDLAGTEGFGLTSSHTASASRSA